MAAGTSVPTTLLHHLKHNQVLHEHVVLLTLLTEEIPRVPQAGRFTVEALELGFTRIVARYGYLEAVDVPKLLERVSVKIGRACYDPMETSFYLGRESLVPPERGNIFKRLLLHLFVRMHKNELDVTSHLGLPPNRVVELGARLDLVAR